MKPVGVSQRATVEMAHAASASRRRVERWFYITAALFMNLLSVVGFGPSIIDHSRRNAPLTPLATAHGIVVGAWLLLFLTQATLVATRRTAVHRRLGVVGSVLAVVMIVLGYAAIIGFGRRGYDLSGDVIRALSRSGLRRRDAAGLLFPLAGLLNFGGLAAAGLWYRHRPDIHKRLMLLALAPLVSEPILHLVGHLTGRWPTLQGKGISISVPITILLLSASAIYDRVSRGRIHPISLWVPVLLFAWQNVLVFLVFPSAARHKFAAWLIA